MFNFDDKKNRATDYVILKCINDAHIRITEVYLDALKTNNNSAELFNILSFFEDQKENIKNDNFDIEYVFAKHPFFRALINNEILEQLPQDCYLQEYKSTAKRLIAINNEFISNEFEQFINRNDVFDMNF